MCCRKACQKMMMSKVVFLSSQEEMTDASKSEGEFLYRTDMPPEKDPVLHLLARLQHDAPQYGLYNLSNKQVRFGVM